jgi:Protein of unknown function (DUF3467)
VDKEVHRVDDRGVSNPVPSDAQPPPVEIVVPEQLIPGAYANGLAVWSTKHEFTLDFVSLQPPQSFVDSEGVPSVKNVAQVVARVKVPVGILYDILQAITNHMSDYEAQHGNLPGAQGPTDVPPIPGGL